MTSQPINIPEVIKTEFGNRTAWEISLHRIDLIPTVAGWQVLATREGFSRLYILSDPDGDFYESREEAMETVEAWIEAAVELETEWED
jgi:hypothetical protein